MGRRPYELQLPARNAQHGRMLPSALQPSVGGADSGIRHCRPSPNGGPGLALGPAGYGLDQDFSLPLVPRGAAATGSAVAITLRLPQ